MKWSEFESKYPRNLYNKARNLCEECHGDVMKKRGFAPPFLQPLLPARRLEVLPLQQYQGDIQGAIRRAAARRLKK